MNAAAQHEWELDLTPACEPEVTNVSVKFASDLRLYCVLSAYQPMLQHRVSVDGAEASEDLEVKRWAIDILRCSEANRCLTFCFSL